jgi:hypothetical protein
MFNARKLAAVDLAFLGPRVVLPEFILGVVGPIGLGIWTIAKIPSMGGILFGVYLLLIGLNYVPLLWHAISLVRQGTAHQEISSEAEDKRKMFRKYRRQSLLLLLPLIVPAVALWELTSAKKPAANA